MPRKPMTSPKRLEQIRKAYAAGHTYLELSKMFHTDNHIISRALHGERSPRKQKVQVVVWRRHPSRRDAVISNRGGLVVFVRPESREVWLRVWREEQKKPRTVDSDLW